MNDGVTTADLAFWLRPAGIDFSRDRLAALDDVVVELAGNIAGRELDAVDAAHGHMSDPARALAATVLGEKAPSVDVQDATALLEYLIAAAVMKSLDGGGSGIPCALAIGSARFLALKPVIADLPARATEMLDGAGRSARRRAAIDIAAASGALSLLPDAPVDNEEATEPPNISGIADDLGACTQSLRSLAGALDGALDALVKRQDALDEEVEMLWWALRATDDAGTPFSQLEPALRVAVAASELADRTKTLPGPPSAGFLLGRVLTDHQEDEIKLADLASALLQRRRLGVAPHRLLVLLSAGAEQARQGAEKDDETWQKVVERTLGVDLATKTTLAAGAQQVYRELLLERLLAANT